MLVELLTLFVFVLMLLLLQLLVDLLLLLLHGSVCSSARDGDKQQQHRKLSNKF